MNLPPSVSLATAKSIYAVSNTPIYLIKRLLIDDPNVRLISQSLPADKLLADLEAAGSNPADNMEALVLPYVLLAALAMRDQNMLRRSTNFQPHADYKWLGYLRDVLIQMQQSINRAEWAVPNMRQGNYSIGSTSAPANVRIVQ